jgi:ATP-dependent protease ClpP protease subunit
MTGPVYPLKCRIRDEDGGVTRVDVYDDIGDYGWSGGISAQEFVSQVSAVRGALEVHINSGGGDVFDGVAIGNAIRSHPGDTATFNDGIAASIASVIFQAGKKRVAQEGSMQMIHDAFGGCMGDASDMARMAGTLDKVSDNIASIYASRAGGTAESWRAVMKAERWYTAEEQVADGLADEVGKGSAELPPGLDVAAFTTVPGRIAARLREMPVAVRQRPENAARAPGGDQGDPAPAASGTEPQDHGATPEKTCADLGHQCCKDAGTSDSLTADQVRAIARDEIAAADKKPMHGDHEKYDPDGDGDCDACPEGDTDHDYWSEDGKQLKPVPGKPLTDAMGHQILAAVVDETPWDGPAAMSWASSQDDPAAAFKAICAGEKTDGDPGTQDHWSLPHHKHAGDPPNAHGVSAALGRLGQAEGLKNKSAAESHLRSHQSAAGGTDDGDGTDDKAGLDLSGIDLEQLGNQLSEALKGATA